MYVVMTKARLTGPKEAFVQRTRDHLLPLARGRTDLKGYCGFASEGGSAYVIGIFGDRGSALQIQERASGWIGANLRDLLPEEPEVIGGEAVFHKVEQPQEQEKDRHQPLFALVRTYHGLPGQAETMHSLVSEHTLPTLVNAPGFRGFYAFRDEKNPDRAMSLTLFNSRDEALHAHAELIGILRGNLGELAYQAPEMECGETIFLATS